MGIRLGIAVGLSIGKRHGVDGAKTSGAKKQPPGNIVIWSYVAPWFIGSGRKKSNSEAATTKETANQASSTFEGTDAPSVHTEVLSTLKNPRRAASRSQKWCWGVGTTKKRKKKKKESFSGRSSL